ncbi:hypothetical protein EVAR_50672_1 [Eumeta japonica]|uniref:Uncharacterized protein n=1 Tax=Eumeta variegata TaxID=151549 RepID=A0A4C1XND3_EUMVA|nr:hypothetical protein EVAR_50672_1 [Eumeta japonica]
MLKTYLIAITSFSSGDTDNLKSVFSCRKIRFVTECIARRKLAANTRRKCCAPARVRDVLAARSPRRCSQTASMIRPLIMSRLFTLEEFSAREPTLSVPTMSYGVSNRLQLITQPDSERWTSTAEHGPLPSHPTRSKAGIDGVDRCSCSSLLTEWPRVPRLFYRVIPNEHYLLMQAVSSLQTGTERASMAGVRSCVRRTPITAETGHRPVVVSVMPSRSTPPATPSGPSSLTVHSQRTHPMYCPPRTLPSRHPAPSGTDDGERERIRFTRASLVM